MREDLQISGDEADRRGYRSKDRDGPAPEDVFPYVWHERRKENKREFSFRVEYSLKKAGVRLPELTFFTKNCQRLAATTAAEELSVRTTAGELHVPYPSGYAVALPTSKALLLEREKSSSNRESASCWV